jgi:N-acetylglucosaminyl-diphospho-decaprenol L-rhamnosyltransferase
VSAAFDVVIVAYRSRDCIASCVTNARALAGVGDVAVVDHGDDGSGDVARDAGARVLHDPTNPGFGAGQNRGVAATTAPYVLLLNPDADPDPVGVAAARRALDASPRVGAVQGVIVNRATRLPERSQGRELGPVHLLGRAVGARRLLSYRPVRAVAGRLGIVADHVVRVPSAPESVESLAATALLVRREAFATVGGFDPSFFLYGEDLDLCRRLRVAGWELLAIPERSAYHDNGASSSTTTERELSWWRGTMRFSALWWSTAAWIIALAAATMEWARLSVREPRTSRRAWQALVAGPWHDRRSRPV